MKRKILPLVSVLILILAAGAALYPTVSAWINNMLAKGEISRYNDTVDVLSAEDKARLLNQARLYNDSIDNYFSDSFSSEAFIDDAAYLDTLNLSDNGQIGTVEIPCIDCSLPIYHGSDEDMLSKGAIHMVGTSLPIGGESTHAVISAHTAYPGKILFDRLTDMEVGDSFSVTVLGDTLNYKVIDIKVVLPSEVSYLEIERGKDLVTLMTCTPYSVNTHRLLVTGERDYDVPVEEQIPVVTSGESAPIYITLAVLVVISVSIIFCKVRKRRNEE